MIVIEKNRIGGVERWNGQQRQSICAVWVLLIVLMGWATTDVHGSNGPKPVNGATIRFLNNGPQEPAVQAPSGWPLNLEVRLDPGKFKGIYKRSISPFPGRGVRIEAFLGTPLAKETQKPSGSVNKGNEQHLRKVPRFSSQPPKVVFRPGLTVPRGGAGARPKVPGFDDDSGTVEPVPVGPFLGSKKKGYGYGFNTRFPGLVLVADGGPGVATDGKFNRLQPLVARNLAGFFQSISYQLRDAHGGTTVMAHMNVPRGLFVPVVQTDSCLPKGCQLSPQFLQQEQGQSWGRGLERRPQRKTQQKPQQKSQRRRRPHAQISSGNVLRKADGGPLICVKDSRFPISLTPPGTVITLRAFLVNGKAPDRLVDLDGDGVVTRKDAIKAGKLVLSPEAVYRVRTTDATWVHFDFDGDLRADCSAGGNLNPMELTPPPP